ncbi:MAG: lysophospholipid acyltransferase family protein [Deltaproteobacteria bacterium]|nr:lysophospholipid acyltransferase family protein [Deltaproteobacteria bacterium]
MAKKIGPIRYISYFFERLCFAFSVFLFRILPIRYIYLLAKFTGIAVSYLIPGHRRRVMGNLYLAFGAEKNSKDKLAIYRSANINLTKNFFEMLCSANNGRQPELIKYIQIVGRENLDASLRKRNGVIAIGGHFGNFTIMGLKMKDAGYRFHTVVRDFTDPLRQKIYEKYRSQQGQPLIYSRPPRKALKNILQALRRNEIVFIITDENKRGAKVFVNFFNRPAATAPGPAILHLRTGADIMPVFLIRNQDNTHKLIIEPPLNISYRGNHRGDVEEITSLITRKIEEYVRRYPSQWMWTHRRWRSRPPEEKARGIDPAYWRY